MQQGSFRKRALSGCSFSMTFWAPISYQVLDHMSMGCVRGEHDTVFRRMDFVKVHAHFEGQFAAFRRPERHVSTDASIVQDQALRSAREARTMTAEDRAR